MGYLNYLDDIQQLVGFQVQSLVVTPNSIDLNFSRGTVWDGESTSIDIEAGFEFTNAAEHVVAWQANDQAAFRQAAACLIKLIERTVTNAKQSASGEIEIALSDNSTLRLLIDPRGFDSFTVCAIEKTTNK